MSKKMKLIPEALYKRLIMDDDVTDETRLKQNKREVLSTEDIPDELKATMYQEFSRRLYEKQTKEANKPLLVKTQDEKSSTMGVVTPSNQEAYIKKMVGSPRTEKMIEALKFVGVSYNKSNNIVIGSTVVAGSNVVDILRCLSNASLSRDNVEGIDSIMSLLKASNVEKSIFPPAIRRMIGGKGQRGKGPYTSSWQRF